MLEQPDAVVRVHEAYLRAGAMAITTATFRTTQRTLDAAGRPEHEATVIDRAVRLARDARDLLAAITAELQSLDLWESVSPPPEALASEAPFAFDHLQFHQWLQWIFLPRTHALLDAGGRLPPDCSIAPILWRLPVYGIELGSQAGPIDAYMKRVFERRSFQESLTELEQEMRL